MNSKPPRVTVRIDRISVDRPGLDRAALETALREEISRLLSGPEAAAFHSGNSASVRTVLPSSGGSLRTRVAAATVNAIRTRKS